MRLSTLIQEANAGVRSGTSRTVFLFLALVTTNLAYLALDGDNLGRIEDRYLEYTEHGGTSFEAAAADEIHGATCENLNDTPGVISAAALRLDRKVFPAVLPALPFDLVSATPSFAEQLDIVDIGTQIRSGIAIGTDVATRLGIGVGEALLTTTGEALDVIAVFDIAWDDPQLANSLIEFVTPDASFDRCVVRLGTPGVDGAFLAAVAASGPSSPTTSSLNPALGDAPEFASLVSTRSTSWLRYLPAMVGFVVALSIMIRRSLELSVMANLGIRRLDLVAISVLETVALVPIVAMATLGPWFLLRLNLQTSGFRTFFDNETLRTMTLGISGALAGTVLATPFIKRSRILRSYRVR